MRRALTTLAFLLTASWTMASDWPQWLGPTRDGVTTEKVSPWKDSPKVLWRVKVGEGHSSPVVADGKVYLHALGKDKQSGDKKAYESVSSFDTLTGALHHEFLDTRHEATFVNPFGNGPRATPCVSDGHTYALGATGLLTCVDNRSGKEKWQVDTLKTFDTKNLFFGVSGSPLLDGNHVLLNVGGKGASIVALDKDTGKVAWQKLDDPASYSSGIVTGEGAARQAIFLTDKGLVSLSPVDGTQFWNYPFADELNESATTPVRVGDLLIASTVKSGAVALRLETKDGKPSAKEVWKNPELTCYFSTPVPVGKDYLYMVTGEASLFDPQATLRCVEVATGKVLWSKPKVGKYHACLIRTANDKLLMLQDTGEVVLLDPDPKDYRELCRAKVCGETWAHPALADGLLYVRDNKELICLRLSE
jgi:outer membrane protein assembly factor BamB